MARGWPLGACLCVYARRQGRGADRGGGVKWLVAILTALFQALLPWLARQSRPTAGSADPDRQTRDRLRDRVRKHWGKS